MRHLILGGTCGALAAAGLMMEGAPLWLALALGLAVMQALASAGRLLAQAARRADAWVDRQALAARNLRTDAAEVTAWAEARLG